MTPKFLLAILLERGDPAQRKWTNPLGLNHNSRRNRVTTCHAVNAFCSSFTFKISPQKNIIPIETMSGNINADLRARANSARAAAAAQLAPAPALDPAAVAARAAWRP